VVTVSVTPEARVGESRFSLLAVLCHDGEHWVTWGYAGGGVFVLYDDETVVVKQLREPFVFDRPILIAYGTQ
jgi:hypothetical protein